MGLNQTFEIDVILLSRKIIMYGYVLLNFPFQFRDFVLLHFVIQV